MGRRTVLAVVLACVGMGWSGAGLVAQAVPTPAAAPYVPEDHRPPLFVRETFPLPPEPAMLNLPMAQVKLSAANMELRIYGEVQNPPGPHVTRAPDHGGLELARRASPKDDPTFVYWGPCFKPCAFALRDKNNFVDLTGLAKIKWRSWQTGYHTLRPIVKLADGTWLVGDYGEPATSDWNEREFAVLDVRWKRFSADKVVTAVEDAWTEKPDLSKVDEIGVADLMPGNSAEGGHGRASTSRLDWIEVWGTPVKR